MNLPPQLPPTTPPSQDLKPAPFSPPATSSPTQPAGLASGARGMTDPTPSTASVIPGAAAPNRVTETPAPRARGSLRRTAAVAAVSFMLGGAVATGGFVAGQQTNASGADEVGSGISTALLRNDDSSDSANGANGSDRAETGSDSVTTAPQAGDADGDDFSTDGLPAITNPAAVVAELVGPSVVQVETNRGQGSGVVYGDGLILTNEHVIRGASQVQVRTSEGEVFAVEVVGGDARNDVAVLRVDDADRSGSQAALPVARIGDSDNLRVGDLAVAIGSPFALQQTVTSGIVSSVNRPVINDAGTYNAQIQTDAPINPGNSGGALANSAGEVIGINSSIRTDGVSASNVGIGFAIPIDTAVRVADRIVAGEALEPGVLGVSGGGVDGDLGVPITAVTTGSGADTAGLLAGDRLLTIDNAPVTSIDEVVGLVQSHFPGEPVELTYLRNGEERSTVAVLG